MKDFKLIEIKPSIFFLDFKDSYKLAMHFLRYQEYYESASSKFRGKSFTILQFMEWYSKTYGNGAFTYPIDWSGFNIADNIIKEVHSKEIIDPNQYDETMLTVYKECASKCPDKPFYIIGAVGKSFAMKHEIAHGFFYTEPTYKKEMTQLVKGLKSSLRNKMYKAFNKIGYTPKVYIDECQAYLATGFTNAFGIKLKNEHKPFIKLYNEYYKNV